VWSNKDGVEFKPSTQGAPATGAAGKPIQRRYDSKVTPEMKTIADAYTSILGKNFVNERLGVNAKAEAETGIKDGLGGLFPDDAYKQTMLDILAPTEGYVTSKEHDNGTLGRFRKRDITTIFTGLRTDLNLPQRNANIQAAKQAIASGDAEAIKAALRTAYTEALESHTTNDPWFSNLEKTASSQPDKSLADVLMADKGGVLMLAGIGTQRWHGTSGMVTRATKVASDAYANKLAETKDEGKAIQAFKDSYIANTPAKGYDRGKDEPDSSKQATYSRALETFRHKLITDGAAQFGQQTSPVPNTLPTTPNAAPQQAPRLIPKKTGSLVATPIPAPKNAKPVAQPIYKPKKEANGIYSLPATAMPNYKETGLKGIVLDAEAMKTANNMTYVYNDGRKVNYRKVNGKWVKR
jgi:hypothetical protein